MTFVFSIVFFSLMNSAFSRSVPANFNVNFGGNFRFDRFEKDYGWAIEPKEPYLHNSCQVIQEAVRTNDTYTSLFYDDNVPPRNYTRDNSTDPVNYACGLIMSVDRVNNGFISFVARPPPTSDCWAVLNLDYEDPNEEKYEVEIALVGVNKKIEYGVRCKGVNVIEREEGNHDLTEGFHEFGVLLISTSPINSENKIFFYLNGSVDYESTDPGIEWPFDDVFNTDDDIGWRLEFKVFCGEYGWPASGAYSPQEFQIKSVCYQEGLESYPINGECNFTVEQTPVNNDNGVAIFVGIMFTIASCLVGVLVIVLCVFVIAVLIFIGVRVISPDCFNKLKIKKKLKEKEKEKEKDRDVLKDLDKIDEDESSKLMARLITNNSLFTIEMNELKIKRSCGRGGFATVYLADWNDITVAFKSFDTKLIGESHDDFTEFERELELVSSLSHPNIPRFYGSSLKPPRVGIVIEFCENGSLKGYFTENPKSVNFKGKIKILCDTSNGYRFLHSKDIIHRDVKCENILLTKDMTPKIIDFGLSCQDTNKTKTMRVGTSCFMAPEVFFGKKYTKKCDVFSFAIVMWCVLAEIFDPYGKSVSYNVESKVANDESFRPNLNLIDEKIRNDEKWIIELITKNWCYKDEKRDDFNEIYNILKSKIVE